MTDKPFVSIHTDGACSPNPGVGGWGAILVSPRHDKREEISGAEAHTTNNRMELRAALEALRALKRPCTVRLHSDSPYLCNALEKG
jgi:ribonuclease HI